MKTAKGYIAVLCPGHHMADRRGYVMEHILVWEEASGMQLPDNCCIHHLNGIKDDNRIENLCVMLHTAHTAFHHKGMKRRAETKALISAKAKEHLADKRNHPAYKDVDISQIQRLIENGSTVMDACKAVGIGKTAYYRKRREQNEHS